MDSGKKSTKSLLALHEEIQKSTQDNKEPVPAV